MNLPVAPPAFDATTGPGRRSRADRGADIGAGCGLVFLELIALAVIFGLWFLSGFNLDPGKTVTTDSLWNYLAAAGGVGVLAIAAAAIAARAGAVVTVVTHVAVGPAFAVQFGQRLHAAEGHTDDQRADVPVSTFVDMLTQAREHIDVLVYAAVFLHEAYPRLNELLKERAAEGCAVRIALGDADSPNVQQNMPPALLRRRCQTGAP